MLSQPQPAPVGSNAGISPRSLSQPASIGFPVAAPSGARRYCDACERARPAAGFVHYDRYELCNACAIEYQVARAGGLIATAGQYVRDKRFGDGDLYVLG